MAIAGAATAAATVAYLCLLVDGELVVTRGTALRAGCSSVSEAVEWLRAGQRATVAGADMAGLRAELAKVSEDGPVAAGYEHHAEDWVQ